MPKILRIANRFNLGGPTYNVAYLTKFMPENYETLLVGGEKDESEDSSEFILNKYGLKPIIIPEMKREINPKMDYLAYKKLKQIINEFKPDIVHTHASKAGALGRLAASSCKVPIIVHTFHGHVFHSYFGKLKTSFYKTIERYLAKKSSAIIAISEQQKLELSSIHKICKAEKINIIPLGFDLSRFQEEKAAKRTDFRKKYLIKDDEIAIGIIGRLVPIKNHGLFLDAIKTVKEQTNKKIRAFIIGDGEEKEAIKKGAKSLNLDFVEGIGKIATVTFTSWIKNVDWAYAGLDIVCLSSLNEGTPVSLIEAQASGKPIVATDVGGVKDTVVENKTAFLSPKDDNHSFVKNLLKLCDDEKLLIEFSSNGWEVVKEKFHYTRLVNDMNKMYNQLGNKHKN